VNPLTRERALLDPARVALASGDAARALQQTKRHAQEFPKGLLSEEREAIAINALVILGNYAKARQRTEAFRANYPQSLQMHSIDAVMANVPKQ
jgi:outer membrane protein assembly factor BamD (BamD/ComL family)